MYKGLVVHHIPGRLRLKLPFLKGFSSSADQVQDLMLPLTGIRKVDFNPITASALITYDPEQYDTFLDQLGEYARTNFGLTLVVPETGRNNSQRNGNGVRGGPTDISCLVVSTFKRLNDEVSQLSGNGVDLKSLMPLGLAAYAISSIGSAATTPLWVTLGLFSFSSFVSLHPGESAESGTRERRKKRRPKGVSHHPNGSS